MISVLDACVYDQSNERLVQNEGITRCLNSGHCVNGNVTAGNYDCECADGYTGTKCETGN